VKYINSKNDADTYNLYLILKNANKNRTRHVLQNMHAKFYGNYLQCLLSMNASLFHAYNNTSNNITYNNSNSAFHIKTMLNKLGLSNINQENGNFTF
jgi:hypothetical protein